MRATAKHLRISPRKARLVAGLIRRKTVSDALDQLFYSEKKAGRLLEKVVRSAVANAEANDAKRASSLIISQVLVNEGATLKRGRPRNKGRTARILKRTSHFTVILEEER